MKYRRLGKTEIRVSEVSLGTWQLGGGWGKTYDKSVARKILETAIEKGVNFLDTADVYSDQQSEKSVGEMVKEDRDNLYIATKIGRRINPHVNEGYTPEVLEKYVDEALINTGLEYIDLVQLHCPPSPVYSRDDIFQKLEDIRNSGKVRHFGISVETVNEAIQGVKYPIVETVQIIFNMFRQKPLEECFDYLSSKDIGIISRVPLASGLLSGRMSRNRNFDKGDHRFFNRNGEAFDKGETFSGVPLEIGFEAVEHLGKHFDLKHLYLAAIKWILMFDEVSTVIPGASNTDQLSSNVLAVDLPDLKRDQLIAVEKIYNDLIREHVHHLW